MLHKAILEKKEEKLTAIIEENKEEFDAMQEEFDAMQTLIEKNAAFEENFIAWKDTESQNDLNLILTLVASIPFSIAISLFSLFCILRFTKCGRKSNSKPTIV